VISNVQHSPKPGTGGRIPEGAPKVSSGCGAPTLWTAGAVTTHVQGLPSALEALLLLAGAMVVDEPIKDEQERSSDDWIGEQDREWLADAVSVVVCRASQEQMGVSGRQEWAEICPERG
jgi:hypothetical protein